MLVQDLKICHILLFPHNLNLTLIKKILLVSLCILLMSRSAAHVEHVNQPAACEI
jgi:hypothetical protein